MYHPDTKLQWMGERTGHGVVAKAFIPRGTIVWLPDSLYKVLSQAKVRLLAPQVFVRGCPL
jgi:uncharacterized protein